METKTIWLDGKFVAAAEATCAISCASLMDGMVVLEDVPLFKNERGGFMFRVDDHVKQFERSAKIAQIELPHASSKLAKAALKVAKASVVNGCNEGIVRFIAYFGGATPIDGSLPLGGRASVAIFCMPFSGEGELVPAGSDICADAPRKSTDSNCAACPEMATAGISSWRAISNNALPPQAELAASRANVAFALREARQRGFDEPILLNEAGDVCSGARKAVFAVRDGVLSTPPLACGVRESVERDTVINFAMDLDVPIVEERMTRADLCIADELFLCDAVRGVIPVSSIDGCTIGKPGKAGPKPGPITKAIQERCAKMMAGKLDEYAAWIAQVE